MNRRSLFVLAWLITTPIWVYCSEPKIITKETTSRIVSVTVYRTNALITREVDVPEGIGTFELEIKGLPHAVQHESLYSEALNGTRILATRSRTRVVAEDTREEVRTLQNKLKELQAISDRMQSEITTLEQNMQTLTKLEAFTAATLQQITDKGLMNSEATIKLAEFIMNTRKQRAADVVTLKQQKATNQEQIDFTQRQLKTVSTRGGRTENDAIIVVDKVGQAATKVRLNYLVTNATWNPQYKLRAQKMTEPVQLEYLAAVAQDTGEDWNNVQLILSTAQPMLNAAPPSLKKLEVTVAPVITTRVPAPQTAGQAGPVNYKQLEMQSQQLRGKAQMEYNANRAWDATKSINDAAALEQWCDIAMLRDQEPQRLEEQDDQSTSFKEGPTVTYTLASRLSIPSRQDEQVLQITRIDLAPDFYYKAVPVLTSHVYRQANLVNKSDYVLLPGEATMYFGTDFVGRTALPLVAIGEQFTAGFGVDPQLQVQRRLIDKSKTMQGGNQVQRFDYRILVNSYKAQAIKLQVWDRLPYSENQNVAVTLVNQTPDLSKDPLYLREERTKNLLRWDVTVDPNTNGEKALAINYQFKVELDRQMQLSAFTTK